MDDLTKEFKSESKSLVEKMVEILEDAEEGIEHRRRLEDFGQLVDRIMGGAKSLAEISQSKEQLQHIGSYAEICKIVGYKGSQIEDNAEFYTVVVAFLLDACEMLEQFIQRLGEDWQMKQLLESTFLDRLKWLSKHFSENLRGTLRVEGVDPADKKSEVLNQQKIDALLAEMGITDESD